MKIMERFQKIVGAEDGARVKVRKALGLDITASDADVLAAINAKKAAIEAAKSAAALDRVMAKYNIKQHAEPRTETNVFEDRARSYLSKSAEQSFEQHRREVEAAARAELQKLQKSGGVLEPYKPVQSKPDVYAGINPGTISGTEAYDLDDAMGKLRELAEARRKANSKLTREQAFARVYDENPELAAREREQRLGALRDE